jgi:NAD(P)-dependent dehydrogenase (short-subunit alcohol dehydrogenase family)
MLPRVCRVALVTGGASGIGYEVARQLGLHGAKVSRVTARTCQRQLLPAVQCGIKPHCYVQLMLMGRRQAFIDRALDVLKEEGITCAGECLTHCHVSADMMNDLSDLLFVGYLHFRLQRRCEVSRGC